MKTETKEVRTESLKILVHRKKCQTINSCKISLGLLNL